MFGIVHTDPRPIDNDQRFLIRWSGDIEIIADQVVSVEASVNVHPFAKQPRALGPAIDIFHRFDGPQQYGGRVPFMLGHDVHAVVHAVNQIDVRMSGRTEHDFGSFGQSFGGMGGEIVGAEVCFIFHDPADALHAI